jgi:hypothetical protein
MKIDPEYMYGHCRGELGRGHVERCPKSWLISARVYAREHGDMGMVEACTIALDVRRSGSTRNPRLVEMRKLAGRKLGAPS